ncbi:MAG: DNA primase DnaG, partial [Nitrososphaera sp.]
MPSTGIVKYHVKLKFEVDGLVEKADIIGAIFGQTEGLLGPEMNLNEL